MKARGLARLAALCAATFALVSCAREAEVHGWPPEGRDIGPGLWRHFEPLADREAPDPLLERVKELAEREKARTPERPAGSPTGEAGEGPPSQEEGTAGSAAGGASPPVRASVDAPAGIARFKLGAGDVLDIVVSGRPEFSGELVVREDGRLALPTTSDLVGAAGLTTAGFSGAVAEALYPRYLRKRPQVSVSVRSSPRLVYYVFGAVSSPGRYVMPPAGTTVLDAVLVASRGPGESESAAAERNRHAVGFRPVRGALYDRVRVVTRGGKTRTVDLRSAMRGGPGSGGPVEPGSHVIVPERSGRFGRRELERGPGAEGPSAEGAEE